MKAKLVGAEVVTFNDGSKRTHLFAGIDEPLNRFGCEYVSFWASCDREFHFGDVVDLKFSRKFKKWYLVK